MDFILAQAVGLVALLLSAVSFQQNTHKRIMLCQTAAGFLFALHFYLIGAPTGAVTNTIAGVRGIIFYHRDKKWAANKVWPSVLCSICRVRPFNVAGAALTFADFCNDHQHFHLCGDRPGCRADYDPVFQPFMAGL